jgi:hypothetical protein
VRRSSLGLLAATATATVAATLAAASPARADTSSWFSFGPAYALNKNFTSSNLDRAGGLTYAMGVGSTPIAPAVFGFMVRGTTYFTQGTDASVALRGATGGFARGDWGAALDAGVVGRFWGGQAYGAFPIQTILTLGAPWGLQLGLGATFWDVSGQQSALGGFAFVEIDLLRLTLMRQGATERFWPNPMPAGGRADGQASP